MSAYELSKSIGWVLTVAAGCFAGACAGGALITWLMEWIEKRRAGK